MIDLSEMINNNKKIKLLDDEIKQTNLIKTELANRLQLKKETIIDVKLFQILEFLGFFNKEKPNYINKLISFMFKKNEPLKGYVKLIDYNYNETKKAFIKKLNDIITSKIYNDTKFLNNYIYLTEYKNFKNFFQEILFIIQDLQSQLKEENIEQSEINDIKLILEKIQITIFWCLHEPNINFFLEEFDEIKDILSNNIIHPFQIYLTYDFDLKKIDINKYINRCCTSFLLTQPLKKIIDNHLFSIIPETEPFYIFNNKKDIFIWYFTKSKLRYWIKDVYLIKFSYFLAKNMLIYLKNKEGPCLKQNVYDIKNNLYKYVYVNSLKLKNPQLTTNDYFKMN